MDLSAGYTLLESALPAETLAGLRARHQSPQNERIETTSAALANTPWLSALTTLIAPLSDRPFCLRRALFFNKSPESNWFVPWHQDRTIIVERRVQTKGYNQWTRKDGQWHVEPPVSLLEGMVTLRIHLDEATEANGCLQVLPGSHQHGRLERSEIEDATRKNVAVSIVCNAGDILVMRPLLVHRSRKVAVPSSRRVLHLEFSPDSLPPPLDWD